MRFRRSSLFSLLPVLVSCGTAETSGTGTGGSLGTAASGTGGSSLSGGARATGGVPGSGGSTASGGNTPTGGVTGTGGMTGGAIGGGGTVASGGTSGSGGRGEKGGAGGAGRGGTTSTGGRAGTGGVGAASGGAGGGGGAAGSTGTAGSSGGAMPSDGCGKTAPAQTDAKQTIDVAGTAREYIVNYPTPYDPNHPYRVLYIHHGRGGNAEQNITRNGGWYGVGPLSGGSVIFVSPHGDGDGGTTGWPNTGGRDVAFLRALVTHINATFCVDKSRIFTTGMSYGGNFSNVLGCEMGDIFRAIAPFAGWGPVGGPSGGGGGGRSNCVGKPAAIVTHGTTDGTVDFTSGQASRDFWMAANHCTTMSAAIMPSPCVQYQGCDAGYPVAFCEHTGGHILPTFSGAAIWNFISQF
jgi:polyhydroxybutyrate depolymerase